MKHFCPMCGEQWNDDVCASCGWYEGDHKRYTEPRKSEQGKLLARTKAQAEEIATLQAENARLTQRIRELETANNEIAEEIQQQSDRADAAEAQLRAARAQALEDAAKTLEAGDSSMNDEHYAKWLRARAASERKEGA